MFTPNNRPPQVKVYFNPDADKTKQEFKDECDINVIVRNFVRHGALSPRDINARAAMYADVTDVSDLKSSLAKVEAAKRGFYALSAEVRERFKNSPLLLLEFLADGNNRDEAIKLGLVDGPAPVLASPPVEPPAAS